MTEETTGPPEHRFGKPLPPDPQSLSDAFGLLLREALARRGWVLVPMLFYVVLVGFVDLPDAHRSPVSGVSIAGLIVAAGVSLSLGTQRSRVALVGILAAIVVLCVDLDALQLEAAHFLPLTGLLLYLLVPREHDRSATIVTLLVSALFLALADETGWVPENVMPLPWAGWAAAALASCAVLFAARSRDLLLTLAAILVPSASLAGASGFEAGHRLFASLLCIQLLGLSARPDAIEERDAMGALAIALNRRLSAAALLAPALPLFLIVQVFPGRSWDGAVYVESPVVIRRAGLGELVVYALLLFVAPCLVSLARRFGTSFERLASIPLMAVGIVLGIVAGFGASYVERVGVGEPIGDMVRDLLVAVPGGLWPPFLGVVLAARLGRAHAATIAMLFAGALWFDVAHGLPFSLVRVVFFVGLVPAVAALLLGWGASSRSNGTSLYLYCGLGAALALVLITPWSSWVADGSWDYAPNRAEAFELFRSRVTEFAVEALGLALATVLFVDCLRLARTVFTTCPLPETHVIRTDFAPEQPGRVG